MKLSDIESRIAHRSPFEIEFSYRGERSTLRAERIAVLSYGLSMPKLEGSLAGDVRASAKDLRDRYMDLAPAIARFSATRPVFPARYTDGSLVPERKLPKVPVEELMHEPVPGGPAEDHRARYADEPVYYVSVGYPGTVLGYVTADGIAIVDSIELERRLPLARRVAIEEGLLSAGTSIREQLARNPYLHDGAVVERGEEE